MRCMFVLATIINIIDILYAATTIRLFNLILVFTELNISATFNIRYYRRLKRLLEIYIRCSIAAAKTSGKSC